jgi:hypothetical protein
MDRHYLGFSLFSPYFFAFFAFAVHFFHSLKFFISVYLVVTKYYHQKYLDKNPGGYCHIGSAVFVELISYEAFGRI